MRTRNSTLAFSSTAVLHSHGTSRHFPRGYSYISVSARHCPGDDVPWRLITKCPEKRSVSIVHDWQCLWRVLPSPNVGRSTPDIWKCRLYLAPVTVRATMVARSQRRLPHPAAKVVASPSYGEAPPRSPRLEHDTAPLAGTRDLFGLVAGMEREKGIPGWSDINTKRLRGPGEADGWNSSYLSR